MTREEAYSLDFKVLQSLHEAKMKLINQIYDDFESRTCENCIDKDRSSCPAYDHEYGTTPSDVGFGCNKFERKES